MPTQPTRAERFRTIRDAIMANAHLMRTPKEFRRPGLWELRCGNFWIVYAEPGASGFRKGMLREHNLQIWPGARNDGWGLTLYDYKAANVDWDDRGNIEILSFRSGFWEGELVELLTGTGKVVHLARRA